MSIFNRLLDKEDNQELPGETEAPEKSNDFFFCLNMKYNHAEVGNTSTLRRKKSKKDSSLP